MGVCVSVNIHRGTLRTMSYPFACFFCVFLLRVSFACLGFVVLPPLTLFIIICDCYLTCQVSMCVYVRVRVCACACVSVPVSIFTSVSVSLFLSLCVCTRASTSVSLYVIVYLKPVEQTLYSAAVPINKRLQYPSSKARVCR